MSTKNETPLSDTLRLSEALPWFDGAVELEEEVDAEAETPSPPPVPAAPSADRQTKPLQDEGEIARGGMGSIRKLYDPELRRRIAMKVHEPSSDPKAEQRFIDEARIIGLLDHPNIVPVHDLVVGADGTPTYTMKLVSGLTLTDLIAAQKTLRDLEHILNCLIKVCEALSFVF